MLFVLVSDYNEGCGNLINRTNILYADASVGFVVVLLLKNVKVNFPCLFYFVFANLHPRILFISPLIF